MDAGTDQGLAFTSPNWESVPAEPVYQITPSRPKHPAGSFHYPELEALPAIANIKLHRVSSSAHGEGGWTWCGAAPVKQKRRPLTHRRI